MQRLLTAIYQKTEGEVKQQYRVLNFIELLAFINLFVFYSVYNVNVILGENPGWQLSETFAVWQKLSLWTLIVVCGMTFTQTTHIVLKAFAAIGVGIVCTVVSALLVPGQMMSFK